MYAVNAPWWLRQVTPGNLVWEMPQVAEPTVYFSFDDGPHPVATPFVLKQLQAYNAKATFFCIGKCVTEFPGIFQDIKDGGHSVGNHTNRHLNGYKHQAENYLKDIYDAAALIPGRAFRPPYGRITRREARQLQEAQDPWTIYMWTVLSGDFDTKLSPEKCLKNVLDHVRPGAIVVFHDSAKAWDRLRYALPFALDYCRQKGWKMSGLPT